MTLHLTPAILEGAYSFLRVTPPFSRWKMPHPDELEFCVSRDRTCFGWCDDSQLRSPGSPIRMVLSTACIGHTDTLIHVAAHEMVHVYQDAGKRKLWTRNVEHNADFKRRATSVARYHGFDPRAL